MKRLALRLALALVLGFALNAVLYHFMRDAAEGPVIELTQLRFIKSDDPAPPGEGAPWVLRALPDNWHKTNPGQSGYGWYRGSFTLEEAPVETWAAYLPTVATMHHVFLNGVDIGGADMSGPMRRTLGRPILEPIAPQLLLKGRNELLVRLRVAPNLRGGLGPVTLGPLTTLQPRYEQAQFMRVALPRALNLALFFVGLLVLLLWLRRREERIYGVFAALALVWSLRNFHYFVSLAWMPSALWEAFVLGSLGLVVVLNWIFMRSYTGLAPRRRERLLLLAAVLAFPLFALTPPALAAAVRLPWYVACAGLGIWTIALFLKSLRGAAAQGAGSWVVLGALFATLLLGLTDLAVSAQLLPFGPAARMAYGAPLLLCALVFALAENYFRTYDQARQHTADLERRVHERTRELERTHERLRALERVATLAAERERLMGDMHDGMGSQLITTLEAVERGEPRDIPGLLRGCLDDLRLLIDSLDPSEHSLQLALGNLRYRLEPRLRAAGIALDWEVQDDLSLPAAGAGLQVLRIVQEAVGNAVKHAAATRLRVSLLAEGNSLLLQVADNGRGIAPPAGQAVPPSAQRGIAGMHTRARQLGGTLDVASDAYGTTVTLRLPLPATPALDTPSRV
ncbi:ATP-binding protein [Ramlibacter sp. XY19]|uniref:sensor histidine kinase n=1 Tax=Ramlibacter paludis TaxID=2908000 RepID=UPI0023DAE1D2|nr:ATP-binding protein [Ramlibacter paludis]